MIQLEGITKSFGSLQVLKGIDLMIEKGEVVSIVGPSGAGKTTLLQIMGTLDKPDAGRIVIEGTEVNRLREKELSAFRNKHIGFVFQFHQLLPEFTALENVMIPALIQGVSAGEARRQALEMLEFLGLKERSGHKPAELSGGEKQRVAVARALINRPAVVLADEPSGSLDTRNKEELHRLFFDLRDRLGQTFVIVTHDEGLAQQTDRTIHIVDGKSCLILHRILHRIHPWIRLRMLPRLLRWTLLSKPPLRTTFLAFRSQYLFLPLTVLLWREACLFRKRFRNWKDSEN